MAKKVPNEKEVPEEQIPLTEEQRITQLEKKVGTNKLGLFGIALFLVIVISMSVTAFIILTLREPVETKNEDLTALQLEVAELKKQLITADAKLGKLVLALPELKGQLANSQNTVLRKVMLDQEQGYQQFLTSLQSGTYDLAHMVPGSRTWLEQYSGQINQAMSYSKERVQLLQNLNSNEAINKDDPFFGDDF